MDWFRTRIARLREWLEQETSFNQIQIQVLTDINWITSSSLQRPKDYAINNDIQETHRPNLPRSTMRAPEIAER